MKELPGYIERNITVASEVFALIEKVQYGRVTMTFDVHNARVTNWIAEGNRRFVYRKDEQKNAVIQILKRLKEGQEKKRTENIVFVVKQKDGRINEIEQVSEIHRNYEEADERVAKDSTL